MRPTLALAVGTTFALVPPASAEAVGAGRPRIALSVSPARVSLIAPASRTIEVRNVGAERVVVDIARKSGRQTKQWLSIRPGRLALRSGSRALVTLRVRAQGRAEPGDHQVLLLFTARPVVRSRLAVRMRLGVGVRVRLPGQIVRRLDVRGLQVRRHGRVRLLLVSLANRGNVTEQLRGRLSVTLVRAGRFLSRLRARGLRELPPETRAVVSMRYAGRVRGVVTAVVKVHLAGESRPRERRYRIRL